MSMDDKDKSGDTPDDTPDAKAVEDELAKMKAEQAARPPAPPKAPVKAADEPEPIRPRQEAPASPPAELAASAPAAATGPDPAHGMPPSSDLEAASYKFPKMHPEGTKYVVIAALITAALWWIVDWDILGWLMAGVTVWVFAFFRDPVRVTPQGGDLIVSPADGLVSHIVEVPAPRQLQAPGLLEEDSYTRVSVFMSVFDVHVNRAPVAGTIKRIAYVPGKFVNAELDKASEDNERQYFVIDREGGAPIGMTQIAGLVARRIVKFVREGDRVAAGERIGLIRFGSRVDVFLPNGYVPKVAIGQRAVAGETVLAAMGGERTRGTSS